MSFAAHVRRQLERRGGRDFAIETAKPRIGHLRTTSCSVPPEPLARAAIRYGPI